MPVFIIAMLLAAPVGPPRIEIIRAGDANVIRPSNIKINRVYLLEGSTDLVTWYKITWKIYYGEKYDKGVEVPMIDAREFYRISVF